MSEFLEFGTRSGPKTIITLFSYGGIHRATNGSLVDEMAKACYVLGRADRANEFMAQNGMPPMAKAWPVQCSASPEDALISRSRSVSAQRFLEQSDFEVLIMLDHDLWWVPPSKDYEGDLLHLARQCAETKGIVGAAVSKKVRGQGIASMLKREGEFQFGCDAKLEPAWFVGAAFTAYHREAIKRVSEEGYLLGKHFSEQKLMDCAPGFKPLFMEMVAQHPLDSKVWLHLSEDWAFCHRAREVGVESFISCKPLVVHYGEYGFQVVRDAPPQQQPASQPGQHYEHMLKDGPKISCLHATRGRPQQATDAVKRWAESAADKGSIEYIVSIDDDDETMAGWQPPDVGMPITTVVGPSRGCVDAYNRAYHKSSGKLLIQCHDDLFPPKGWDARLLESIGPEIDQPIALAVDDGLPQRVNNDPDLMTLAIVTRPFAAKLGGLFHPEYVSVLCDNDLSRFARKHGYCRNAKHLTLRHAWEGPDRDETQRRSYQQKNWEQGKEVFGRREAAGFPEVANA